MKVETHFRSLKESLAVLEECIEKGLIDRQRTIGFSTSAACADMLEILLHKKDLIDPGFVINHEWLKSRNKIKEKFPLDFPKKKKILDLIYKIEEKRNILCYGKPQKAEEIQEILNNFNKLRKIFLEVGVDAE